MAEVSHKDLTCEDSNGNEFNVREYECLTRMGSLLVDKSYMYLPDGFVRKFPTLKDAIQAYNEKNC